MVHANNGGISLYGDLAPNAQARSNYPQFMTQFTDAYMCIQAIYVNVSATNHPVNTNHDWCSNNKGNIGYHGIKNNTDFQK